jgi:hypothetical protein
VELLEMTVQILLDGTGIIQLQYQLLIL